MSANAPAEIVVEANWYSAVGRGDVSGLIQVRRNHVFDGNRFVFLKNCVAENFVMWKSNPWSHACKVYDVIQQ
jgi:hypothetical protein